MYNFLQIFFAINDNARETVCPAKSWLSIVKDKVWTEYFFWYTFETRWKITKMYLSLKLDTY